MAHLSSRAKASPVTSLSWLTTSIRRQRSLKPVRLCKEDWPYGRSGRYIQHLAPIMIEVQNEIGALYKENFGQLVSLLLLRFPGLSIESAEDAVQDAFAEASALWAKSG